MESRDSDEKSIFDSDPSGQAYQEENRAGFPVRSTSRVPAESGELSALRPADMPHFRKSVHPTPTPKRVEPPKAWRSDADEQVPHGRMSYFQRRLGILDFFFALFVAIAGCAAVVATYNGLGHSWDEALYLFPAEKSTEWVRRLFSEPGEAVTAESIREHWGGRITGTDPLHPEIAPMPKLIIGAGESIGRQVGLDPMIAMRLPIALFFGLTLSLLFILATREYGRIGGFAAVVAYGFMPRVFGHAHIAASETILAFSIVFLTWTFLRGTENGFFAFLAGVAFGVAAATKITALLLPVPLVFWAHFYRRKEYSGNIFAMMFVAPVVTLAVWPWLWHDGIMKLLEYLAFYARHQSTAVFYLGQKWGYGQAAAPWHYPFVTSMVVLPEWVLLFLALGVARTLIYLRSRPASALFLMLALFQMCIAALPNMPKYDGERLFFPAFAFLALLTGAGVSGIFSWGARKMSEEVVFVHKSWAAGVLILILAGFGGMDIWLSHPNELNWFNRLMGGPRGAYGSFETSYWGEAVNEDVLREIRKIAKPGDRVRPLALEELVFKNYQAWGKLPAGVDFSPPDPPDWYILQVRYGMFGNRERKLHLGGKPHKVFTAQGVPRIEIFKGERTPGANVVEAVAKSVQAITSAGVVRRSDAPTTSTDRQTSSPDVLTTSAALPITVPASVITSAPAAVPGPTTRTLGNYRSAPPRRSPSTFISEGTSLTVEIAPAPKNAAVSR